MNFINKYSVLIASMATFLIFLDLCKNQDNKNKFYNIGITQIVEHESLDNARQGFIDELKNLGYEEGKNIKFDFHNAGGDFSNCQSIAQKLVNQKCDLILAISTPSAQAVASATKDIPILIMGITNPKESNLVQSNEQPGNNVTGTSDLSDIKKTINLITKLKPNAQKIGILYSNIDVSPIYQAKVAEEEIKNLGLTPITATVTQINEVQQVTEILMSQVDAIYVPIDKITSSSMTLISDIATRNNKFVVCSENLIDKGAVACCGIDYYNLGKLTAKQTANILEKKSIPQNMPIEYLNDNKIFLNKKLLEKLNMRILDDLSQIAEIIGE